MEEDIAIADIYVPDGRRWKGTKGEAEGRPETSSLFSNF